MTVCVLFLPLQPPDCGGLVLEAQRGVPSLGSDISQRHRALAAGGASQRQRDGADVPAELPVKVPHRGGPGGVPVRGPAEPRGRARGGGGRVRSVVRRRRRRHRRLRVGGVTGGGNGRQNLRARGRVLEALFLPGLWSSTAPTPTPTPSTSRGVEPGRGPVWGPMAGRSGGSPGAGVPSLLGPVSPGGLVGLR